MGDINKIKVINIFQVIFLKVQNWLKGDSRNGGENLLEENLQLNWKIHVLLRGTKKQAF